jgi:hypothetical protein
MLCRLRQAKAPRAGPLSSERCRNENGQFNPEPKKRIQKGKKRLALRSLSA